MKKKTQSKSPVEEIDLLEIFYNTYTQDIGRNLLRNDLEAKDLPNVMEVANLLGVKPEEALVIIAIVYQLKTKSLIKEHHLVELLLPFQSGKQTRLAVRELKDYSTYITMKETEIYTCRMHFKMPLTSMTFPRCLILQIT